MNVEHILSAKGRQVATIAAQATIMEAARTLAERRIGAVPRAGVPARWQRFSPLAGGSRQGTGVAQAGCPRPASQ